MEPQVTFRAFTVRQPWAWAIAHKHKPVENRGRAWHYRGPVAIHAAGRPDVDALTLDMRITAAVQGAQESGSLSPSGLDDLALAYGAIVAIGVLSGCHRAAAVDGAVCCAPWGDADGGRYRECWHLQLDDVVRLDQPIDCLGSLGLWTPPPSIQDKLREVTPW